MPNKKESAVKWLEDKANEFKEKALELNREINRLAQERDACDAKARSLRTSAAIMKENDDKKMTPLKRDSKGKLGVSAKTVSLKGAAKMSELGMKAGPPQGAMVWSCNRCARDFPSPNRPTICENERCNGKSFTLLR
jgi:hypothetical protein